MAGREQNSMDTPIVEFVRKYADSDISRFHMPGHKGHVFFGWEPYDITEIAGADVLYHGDGIIAQSEKNAAKLFGSGATHYSTCGSTNAVKAMLFLLRTGCSQKSDAPRPYILAARNIHRSVVDACALLDLDIEFPDTAKSSSICTSAVTAEHIKKALQEKKQLPLGVYITSPDYLGQMADIAAIAKVCRSFSVPLLVDNAHGAYLHFLERKQHPMDLGAAMCCDSAHKTLPALTGAAYLHIHRDYVKTYEPYAAQALALFSTTSPSYLILQSLDWCNRYMASGYTERLKQLERAVKRQKEGLRGRGIAVLDSEPLKLVMDTAKNGYTGLEIAEELRAFRLECEYADGRYVVLMATAENRERDWKRLQDWAKHTRLIKKKGEPLPEKLFFSYRPKRRLSIREAVFAPAEVVPAAKSLHRICAEQTVACPPAIPIAISGEEITEKMVEAFRQFGITKICVVKNEVL